MVKVALSKSLKVEGLQLSCEYFQAGVHEVESARLFSNFAEVGELKSGTRMDMGWFQRFLHQHGVAPHVFAQLLSIEK